MPGSSGPELETSPINKDLAFNAVARIFISSALLREKASTLLKTLMINVSLSLLPTMSKHIPRRFNADETSNPALASIARVVFMRLSRLTDYRVCYFI